MSLLTKLSCVACSTGLAACYMGIVLINKLSNISMMYWLGPAVAVPMALLLMGLSLEYPKIKVSHYASNAIGASDAAN